MKLNYPMFSQLRDATQTLLTKGPAAATHAIQHALAHLRYGHEPATPSVDTADRETFHAERSRAESELPETPFVEIPRTEAPRAETPRAASPEPTPTPAPAPEFDVTAFTQDLLTSLGLPPELQTGLQSGLTPGMMKFELPQFQMPDFGVPAYDAPPPVTPPGAPGQAQFISGSYRNHAGARNYKLYIPSGYHGQPLPLLVMLHGCTQNPDDFAAGTQMNAVAEEKQCFVVYPEQTAQANNSRCWNWFNALDQQRGQGEPSIIAGIAQQVIDEYPVNPRQVYVAGLSAGGAMAVIVGTLYPDLFSAVGVHSGLPYASARDLPSALSAMKRGASAAHHPPQDGGLPIIVFHGDQDHVVHPRNGEQVLAQRLNGHAVTPAVQTGHVPNGHRYTQTTHRHPDGSPLAEHWVVHGAGHAWSGGSADGSYTDHKGPDASREMMRFFRTVD